MLTDAELLHRYARARDEAAFTNFVQRHTGLVYAAAMRRSNGRRHLSEEVAQKVFTAAAHHAKALSRHPAILGWLHQSTRRAVIDAIRREQHRTRLTADLTTMPPPETDIDWERLHPVLDDALAQLSERDRELVLLRFFEDQHFTTIGLRLHVSENTARMRTNRALERLRTILARHGIKSTAAALGLALMPQALSAAPAPLASTLADAALNTPPASGFSALLSLLLMNKTILPLLSAAAAAITVALATNSFASNSTTNSSSDAAPIEQNIVAITQGITAKHAIKTSDTPPESTNGRHSNHGNATALDAFKTFAWASDAAAISALSRLIYFDEAARAKALEIMATLPPDIRVEYDTPEKFYAFLIAADSLISGPPGADMLQHFTAVEITPDHYAIRRADSQKNFQEYQRTPDGWKWIFPLVGVDRLPKVLNNPTLLKVVNR